MDISVQKIQTELTAEIYSKSSVRAIGKVLLMEFSYNINLKNIKMMNNGLFCKQTVVLVVCINNIGKNSDVLADF